mmetsp:Transcript_18802/g.18631  ORF Transcript_18802/g.18631 Transcript_18802/m.18631 type:complete len:108 (+) Transcript_18802:183-506(+)
MYRSHPGGHNWIDMIANFSATSKSVSMKIRCSPSGEYFGNAFSLRETPEGSPAVEFDSFTSSKYINLLKTYNSHCGPLKADPRKDDFAVYTICRDCIYTTHWMVSAT